MPATDTTLATVYVASKSRFGFMWQEYRAAWRELGLKVNSSWIDESGEGESNDLSDLWLRCIAEASAADFLIAFHTTDDIWKGAYIEIGAALAHRKPVYVIGRPDGSFIHHPFVTLASDPDDAVEDFRAVHLDREWL